MATTARLKFAGITKTFPGVKALTDVSFDVMPGEIHALLGENGAGKSTLLKILSGVQRATDGEFFVDGEVAHFRRPENARAAGIAMIHQELQQVPNLTVAQNMFLGHPLKRAGGLLVDRRQQERRAAEALAMIDPSIDPARPIRELKVAQRQIVEVARALLDNAKIIAMDEPTSSLTPSEFESLAAIVEKLAASGVSIIYVSHKMDEVFRICQRGTVMRDGQVVGGVDLKAACQEDVIAMMVGRELMQEEHHSHAKDAVRLEIRNLSAAKTHVRDVSFDVRRGEVLGIAGLVGSGRTELLRLLAGVDQIAKGTVRFDGEVLKLDNPRAAIAVGIGLLPEERKREGIIPIRPVSINMALPSLGRFAKGGIVRHSAIRKRAEELLKRVNLRPFQIDRPIKLFSGGNQQKAIIARWLAAGSQVLLFDEPTRGIDVGAKSEIYHLIEELAAEGRTIIVVSSELPEVMRVSDRVVVMRNGRIAATLGRAELSEQNIVMHAVGDAGGNIEIKQEHRHV
ncbi:sugar ABC transporter ATP-binding protein [Sinorhizobium meliloti]|uniref:sugar ABC transporter ATP-binding protein n=1 Tax=Rhizobium meliloti TaxID=382 RepID=UPI000B49F13D|nr:sugar ABC transporter ATP-binding protein [Sinorhizobium meliloti]ASP86771.1 sugar ABC transporter ATP-binding protein [Sinorhizobium meliloti]ASP93448.1 sugar ABC transporter ATP-binding protein [Sinorhizobium meliloti]MQW26546.1 ATP-binding cassette domain-containing protein [Sinorhizobium meliloti]MQX60556.1 ATP-binding cassette domain-containing protein [Sinorhizobium meliloti]RVJ73428.1 sugar ABC transporter ATP-binding protein [Sinorhizobium meliloti]